MVLCDIGAGTGIFTFPATEISSNDIYAHEVENKELMLDEIKRILKQGGKLMIIEFHKRETPMGPPLDHRISEEYVEKISNYSPPHVSEI